MQEKCAKGTRSKGLNGPPLRGGKTYSYWAPANAAAPAARVVTSGFLPPTPGERNIVADSAKHAELVLQLSPRGVRRTHHRIHAKRRACPSKLRSPFFVAGDSSARRDQQPGTKQWNRYRRPGLLVRKTRRRRGLWIGQDWKQVLSGEHQPDVRLRNKFPEGKSEILMSAINAHRCPKVIPKK